MGKRRRSKRRAALFAAAALAGGTFLMGRPMAVFCGTAGSMSVRSGGEGDSLGICICLMGIAAVAALGAWFCSLRAENPERKGGRLR